MRSGGLHPMRPATGEHITAIHIAIAIMPRFSVSETKPSGTFDDPATHAHFSSRRST
jgi:hypothetical protein